MDEEPGTPLAFIICVLVGVAALAVGTIVGVGSMLAITKANEAAPPAARDAVIAGGIVLWAKMVIGLGLLMLGFFKNQQPTVRGGAFIAAALVLASISFHIG
jgi:hypothetical protein